MAIHIVVAIKQVPDTSNVRINPETGTLIREGVPSILNPYEVHALELAVRLKERHGGTVTVLDVVRHRPRGVRRPGVLAGFRQPDAGRDTAGAGVDLSLIHI